ncbi:hypothetical protein CRENBAI_020020 [Crenichthys baileyi]|uniref:Uncharacterized protein n=1 Tax=Crenichthys baileyi TaxID=28760 RepID=A0AAV9SB03_9TELE
MHTLIHTERPINLTGMSLDCGRKPEYPVRTHACTARTCKLHAERTPGRESDPGTFLLQGNSGTNCATVQSGFLIWTALLKKVIFYVMLMLAFSFEDLVIPFLSCKLSDNEFLKEAVAYFLCLDQVHVVEDDGDSKSLVSICLFSLFIPNDS